MPVTRFVCEVHFIKETVDAVLLQKEAAKPDTTFWVAKQLAELRDDANRIWAELGYLEPCKVALPDYVIESVGLDYTIINEAD